MSGPGRITNWLWSPPKRPPGRVVRLLNRLDERCLGPVPAQGDVRSSVQTFVDDDPTDPLDRPGTWADLSPEQRSALQSYVAKGLLSYGKRRRAEEVQRIVAGGPTVVKAWLGDLRSAVAAAEVREFGLTGADPEIGAAAAAARRYQRGPAQSDHGKPT